MKNILTTILLCFAAMAASSQTADIEVSYQARSLFQNGKERLNRYHLLANSTQSKFFSPNSERIDSMTSTPEGRAKFKETQEAALKAMIGQGAITVEKLPRKKETLYVLKNTPDSTITVYDMLSDEPVYYTEPFSELVWTVGDSIKSILGYECVMAETDFHGRHWTAWFTPEIPVQDGPWKFRGLPGLILEAYSGNGLGFYADGIESSSKNIIGVYDADKYEKTDRKVILRIRRAMRDNPMGTLSAKGMLEGVEIRPEDLPGKSDNDDFIETDYR